MSDHGDVIGSCSVMRTTVTKKFAGDLIESEWEMLCFCRSVGFDKRKHLLPLYSLATCGTHTLPLTKPAFAGVCRC